ncbi:MAG: hypothetical protein ACRD35_03945 [Candidatus Acidiferrales bacterium]
MGGFDPAHSFLTKGDKRRSQRVLLVIHLEIIWTTSQGVRVQESAATEVIGAYGALVRLKTRLPLGTEVQLRRAKIQEPASARVTYHGPAGPDGLARLGLELTVPSEQFWGVKIP